MTVSRLLALTALLAAWPAAAQAAKPRERALLEAHRHGTGGHDWHVQVEVNRSATRLTSVLAYAQECDETAFVQRVALRADGSFDVSRRLRDGKGRFVLHGRFVNPDRARGTWKITTADCAFGGDFTAQDATGHFLIGNPYEYPSRSIRGDSTNARRLRRIKLQALANARRFDTRAKARALGYVPSRAAGCPGMNHARKHGTDMWGRVLDPAQPQSLVYWCGAHGGWTLAGYMFRAPAAMRPPTFANLLQWHKHGATKTATWMAHLWLVTDPVSAFATCVPFPAFTAAGMFDYRHYLAAPGNEPCSDTVRS